MSGLDPVQFREDVIEPTLRYLGLTHPQMDTPAAVNLLLGTALQESGLRYLRQIRGPALSPFQVEPATARDLITWAGYHKLLDPLAGLLAGPEGWIDQLPWNLRLACALARLVYWRVPEPLPAADDRPGQARYWKRYYNTPLGRGRPEQYLAAAARCPQAFLA